MPLLRPATRHRISDFCAGRKAMHTAELLAMAVV
jgi:hypothetical protein